ncbi:MAG: four helix bundle protein [Sphingobacteriales bacterium]|nr:MAG: four helix bundle protein [Sphingobacteriales bacterium]
MFAVRVVRAVRFLQELKKEFVLSKQLLRCGTAIGAMIREGEFAESKADFIHKNHVAQKEASECVYWLELLYQTDYLSQSEFQSLHADVVELLKLLTATIKTTKASINH